MRVHAQTPEEVSKAVVGADPSKKKECSAAVPVETPAEVRASTDVHMKAWMDAHVEASVGVRAEAWVGAHVEASVGVHEEASVGVYVEASTRVSARTPEAVWKAVAAACPRGKGP